MESAPPAVFCLRRRLKSIQTKFLPLWSESIDWRRPAEGNVSAVSSHHVIIDPMVPVASSSLASCVSASCHQRNNPSLIRMNLQCLKRQLLVVLFVIAPKKTAAIKPRCGLFFDSNNQLVVLSGACSLSTVATLRGEIVPAHRSNSASS